MAEHIPDATLVEVPGGDVGPYWEHPDLIVAAIEQFVSSIEPVGEPDRQLATIMFTDIVDSTRRADELGDRRWQAMLERHYETARQTVSDQAGHWVKSTGDGILATFAGPGRAIVAAAQLRRATADLDLHMRTGIHIGEIEVGAGDISGIAVHLAARIMAEAGTDEILVSRTVKDLVVGSDLSFEDRGTRSFKGIDEEWQLFAALV
jgi:class 3 adenylate cyclase